MDAAQMLTAQEIARQCERMARVARQTPTEPESSRARRLSLVEPITQPIERVEDDDEPADRDATDDGRVDLDAELTAVECEILAFERQWWKQTGSKDRAIRELFDMSPSRYHRLLEILVQKTAAKRADPMLIKRLRREHFGQHFGQRGRSSHRGGAVPNRRGPSGSTE